MDIDLYLDFVDHNIGDDSLGLAMVFQAIVGDVVAEHLQVGEDLAAVGDVHCELECSLFAWAVAKCMPFDFKGRLMDDSLVWIRSKPYNQMHWWLRSDNHKHT